MLYILNYVIMPKLLVVFTLFFAGLNVSRAATPTISDIISRLATDSAYTAEVDFSVTMPQMPEDVIYTVTLHQRPADTDSLAPCRYLIEWLLTGRDRPVNGFSAYFDGHHYRFSGTKLQEYHTSYDPTPFLPTLLGSSRAIGVQRSAQFVELLPSFLAEKLRSMATDPRYTISLIPDTLISGMPCTVVDAVMTIDGTTAMEGEYVFSRLSLLPLRSTLENNPGAVAEQTVTASYRHAPDSACFTEPLSEQLLIDRWPEPFARFRTGNFRLENLRGLPLPDIAAHTLSGRRYIHSSGSPLRAPTIAVIMNSPQVFNSDLISSIRTLPQILPLSTDILWIFVDSHPESVQQLVGQPVDGEQTLLSARSVARDCGVASLPAIILINSDGTIADSIIGFRKGLSSIIAQKMAFIK